jgi:polysaccharide export outer membrane protein
MKLFRIASFLSALLLSAGCMTPAMDGDFHRMDKYRPVTENIMLPIPAEPVVAEVAPAQGTAATGVVVAVEATVPVATAATGAVVVAEAAVPVAVDGTAATGAVVVAEAVVPVAADGTTSTGAVAGAEASVPVAGADGMGKAQGQRILSRGDRIMISLRGIPVPEDNKNIIDGLGEVTLPYIGQVRVAGLTASDAERLIESTYVEKGIYRSINVIVVAEDKVYFVQGEVAKQGKFSMSGDVTLLQAITEAGGYTPFANRRSVKIIRGEQVLFFNARDIENGRGTDPVIASDDIIVVLKSVF